MIDEAKLVKKSTTYQIATRGGISDRVLLDVATQYQNGVSQKFLSASPKDLAARYPGDEKILVTTKYDGEGVFVYFEAGKPFEIFAFNAPSGRVRVGLPVLEKLRDHLHKKKVRRALFRGELYLPGKANGKRISVSEVVRISFSGTEAELAKLQLAFFDVIMLDGKDMRSGSDNFEPTWDKLRMLLGDEGPWHCARGVIVPEKQVAKVFEETIAAGDEGVVVRRLHRLELVKVKPHVTFDGAIIGYVEGEFEGNYGVLSLLTAVNYTEKKDGETYYQVLARVGSGFTDQFRQDLLARLAPLKLDPPLAMTDSDGRTIHFIKPQLIAEIEADDVVTTSREDKENLTQLLSWNGTTWTFRHMTPSPRLLFPIFGRIREDKEIGSGGARVQQLVPQATTPPIIEQRAKPSTKVVRREVYKKESKGETMVRKLLVLRTEGDADAFPFAIYWTDFSSKRKEPLKISTAFANSERRAETLAQQFLADGLAKGWEKL